mmetsp:Transcript_8412/g.23958  ORF Transcript_8412/g.23958 Transcript_8412/m.23958 type:complete len:126 (-) Transcript_8412:112-489(-)
MTTTTSTSMSMTAQWRMTSMHTAVARISTSTRWRSTRVIKTKRWLRVRIPGQVRGRVRFLLHRTHTVVSRLMVLPVAAVPVGGVRVAMPHDVPRTSRDGKDVNPHGHDGASLQRHPVRRQARHDV